MNLNFFRKLSVKIYLLVVFIVVSTTPVIMLGLIQYKFIDTNILSIMETNNLVEIQALADRIKLYLNLNSKIISFISNEISDKKPNEIKSFFSAILKTNPDFKIILYADNNGNVYAYDNNFYKTNETNLGISKYGFYKQISQRDLVFTGKIEILNKKDLIGIVLPVKDKNNIKGYILAGLGLNKISEFDNTRTEKKHGFVIVDYNDNSIIFPDINNDFWLSNINILEKIKKEGSGLIKNASNIEKTLSFTTIVQPKWIIWMEHPVSDYEEELKKNSLRTLIAAILSIGLALILGLWLAASQHKFVKNLLSSIRAIAKGNYSKKAKVGLTFIPREFDSLIDEFNVMAERIEELDSFKSNLIDTVSHEFRTPLTSIKGFSSTLLRKDATFDKETQRKLLKIISDQSDRLSRMVEDLLVVPKLEGNVLKLNLQELELEPTIEHISKFFPNDSFVINVEPQIWVMVDPDRLEQVLLNLFENAHKYSYPKGSRIKVNAFIEENQAHIIVSNSAEKVPQEKLSSLFNKFVRLDDTLTRTTGGTGLGLYITKGLIELMGGKIWLEADIEFKVHFTVPNADIFSY